MAHPHLALTQEWGGDEMGGVRMGGVRGSS